MSQPPVTPPEPPQYGSQYGSPYGAPSQPPAGPPFGAPTPYGAPSPYGQPGYQPPASKAMAGWALGLSLIGCSLITSVTSIGLAITVLVRSKDGREHGKGLAIAALVISTLWILVIGGLIVFGVVQAIKENKDAPRDASGNVTERAEISVQKLRVGDCFDDASLLGAEGSDLVDEDRVIAVPCAEPHSFETYYVFGLVGQSFPGDTEASRLAVQGCVRQFKGVVGVPARQSELTFGYYYPSETQWDLDERHRVTCALNDPAGPVTGTLRQSNR